MVILIYILSISVSWAQNISKECKDKPATCSSLDIDIPQAKISYEYGCERKDAYSCYRLGQFFEVRRVDIPSAISAYQKSCELKYSEGCDDERKLRSELCYVEKNRAFCKGEPKGEYRILVFLETLNPKYKDAFIQHDFDTSFSVKPVQGLYDRRIKARDAKLLDALKLARKKGKHDGHDAETLNAAIEFLEGKRESLIEDH